MEIQEQLFSEDLLPQRSKKDELDLAFKYARERGMPYYSYTDQEKLIEFEKIQRSDFKNGI